ncbi:hypothetical protein [Lysobacter niastensis]|uniref:Uncharacterized protein n=1 Tax=Lysobacter niastensis TaxID=380629 RepID=A0ABS0B767_9GAMM|nr:hypothetical protein [Lysobacter niastensis]MBF6022859.1 hypothetical protein [Lysobacter niastensis]
MNRRKLKKKREQRRKRQGRSMVTRSPVSSADFLRHAPGLTVMFTLDRNRCIGPQAGVFYDGKPLALVPVESLTRIVDAFPEADTEELLNAVATFHAEQAGIRGNA